MKQIITLLLFICLHSTADAQFRQTTIQQTLQNNLTQQGFSLEDLQQYVVTDNYTSQGISHCYIKQSIEGIEIYNSYGAIHGNQEKISLDHNQLIKGIKNYNFIAKKPSAFSTLLHKISATKNLSSKFDLTVEKQAEGRNQSAVYIAHEISSSPIHTRLVYYKKNKNTYQLGRIFNIDFLETQDHIEFLVDAITGEIIQEHNYTVYCGFGDGHSHTKNHKNYENHETNCEENVSIAPNQYKVYAYPLESPLNGGQTVVTSPWLLDNTGLSSPNGWHNYKGVDYNHTRGNNVDVYLDLDDSERATNGNADRADGGNTLEFLYDYDTNSSVSTAANRNGALTNLFYWNNIIHDMWYQYGFDEASGNFQEDNFTPQGNASDHVKSHCQDGQGTCNANMSTPPDGQNPRMQMYICNGRDGSLDNGVVIHEYTHGISNRLTGGPSLAGCLGNTEQMGEGWSDYFGLIMTIEAGDMATDLRPIGNWLTGENINGGGIRSYPYTTNMAVNPFTYDDIKTQSVPHGVGSVWATMLWDMTWALIEEHGFSTDFYAGTAGNNIAMKLVVEGMKLQVCSPGFVDGRDAILLADELLYNGANKCLIWGAFAQRGLGYSASQGTSNSRGDGTEGYDLPPACNLAITMTNTVTEMQPGGQVSFDISVQNNTTATKTGLVISSDLPNNTSFVSATNQGGLQSGEIVFPSFDLTGGNTYQVQYTLQLSSSIDPCLEDFIDDMENGDALWTKTNSGSTNFVLTTAQASSGQTSWFANDGNTPGLTSIRPSSLIYIGNNSKLIFTHWYDTEVNWDGGLVLISTDNGSSYEDLGPFMTKNGYNDVIYNSIPGFSGNSNGFITTEIDLSSFAGEATLIEFQMNCDQSVGGLGWYIDDVTILDQALSLSASAEVKNTVDSIETSIATPVIINPSPTSFYVESGFISPTCSTNSDGTAYVTPVNALPSYSVLWSTGSTMDTLKNIPAGLYSVTITNGSSTKTDNIVVTEPSPINITFDIVEPTQGTGGSITPTISGGTPPYNFNWSDNALTLDRTGLTPGTFTLNITDANLCTAFETTNLTDPTNCAESLLRLEVLMDDYPGDISYKVTDDNNNIVFQSSPFGNNDRYDLFVEDLCIVDGCYEIEFTDAFSDGLCSSGFADGYYRIIDGETDNILVDSCDFGGSAIHTICWPQLQTQLAKTEPSCSGLTDGNVDLTVNGGTGNITFLYSTGQTTEDLTNIGAGTYTVTITDNQTQIIDSITVFTSIASVYKETGNGAGTLEYAIENGCATDTVRVEDILFDKTITTTAQIELRKNVNILGLGSTHSSISANNNHRIFIISPGSVVSIKDITLENGVSTESGGAIYNIGDLILQDVDMKNNLFNGVPLSLTNEGNLEIKKSVNLKD